MSRASDSGNVDRLFFTIREAATQLAISRATLYRLINRGELDARRIGRRTLVPVDALHQFAHDLKRPKAYGREQRQ